MTFTTFFAMAALADRGSFATGKYENAFARIGQSELEVRRRLDATFHQLFFGDDKSQRVYYPVGKDEGYILDVGNNDVRSEGMSYGMMIAVQMNDQKDFDRIWRWAKRHMQYQSGPWKGYFAWQCKTDGSIIGKTPASDGEEYFVSALIFAANRWKNKTYQREADAILEAAQSKEATKSEALNLFNTKAKQVVFVPFGSAATFTDPSYHLPAFYEIWARKTRKNRDFWRAAAKTSRQFFKKAAHPETGLFPDYAKFDGKPTGAPWDPKSQAMNFNFDAWRVAMNIAIDYSWFKVDPWQVQQTDRYLGFFAKQGIDSYKATYELSGKPTAEYRSEGLIAMNAVAATISTRPDSKKFIQAFWNQPTPSGQWRYYNGMLHMLGMLHVSGNYRAYVAP